MSKQEVGASGQGRPYSRRQFLSDSLTVAGVAAVAGVAGVISKTPAGEAARGALEAGVVRVSGTLDDLRNLIFGIGTETPSANSGKGKAAGGEEEQEKGSLDEDLRQIIEAGSGDPDLTIAKVVRVLGVGVTKILAPHIGRFDRVGEELGAINDDDLDYFVDTSDVMRSIKGFLMGFRDRKRPNTWFTIGGGVLEGKEMIRVIQITLPPQEGQVETRTLLSIGSSEEGF